jgi:hypothetical protein
MWPLYTQDASQDLNSFCATSVGIALADLKYDSPNDILVCAGACGEHLVCARSGCLKPPVSAKAYHTAKRRRGGIVLVTK